MGIGYLTGAEIKALKTMGAVSALYGTSTTREWLGDLTMVYFFDGEGVEIAHQTGITEGFVAYRRKWGECVKKSYDVSQRFAELLQSELEESTVYKIA